MAEIETALVADDIADIGARLLKPRSADLISMLAALMRGGGHDIDDVGAAQLPLSLEDIIGAIVAAFESSGLLRWQNPGAGKPSSEPAEQPADAPEDVAKNQPAPQA